jgi:hypothetical protein
MRVVFVRNSLAFASVFVAYTQWKFIEDFERLKMSSSVDFAVDI